MTRTGDGGQLELVRPTGSQDGSARRSVGTLAFVFKTVFRVMGALIVVIALFGTVDGLIHHHYLRAVLSLVIGGAVGTRLLFFGSWGLRSTQQRQGMETRRCPLCGRETDVPHVGGRGFHLGMTYIAPTPQEIEAACVVQNGPHPVYPSWSPPHNRSRKVRVTCAGSTEAHHFDVLRRVEYLHQNCAFGTWQRDRASKGVNLPGGEPEPAVVVQVPEHAEERSTRTTD
jgi:hypothetical protein